MNKIIAVATFVLLICLSVSAQTGVYLTYDDFKNGALIKSDPNSLEVKALKGKILTKEEGAKKEYEIKKCVCHFN